MFLKILILLVVTIFSSNFSTFYKNYFRILFCLLKVTAVQIFCSHGNPTKWLEVLQIERFWNFTFYLKCWIKCLLAQTDRYFENKYFFFSFYYFFSIWNWANTAWMFVFLLNVNLILIPLFLPYNILCSMLLL